MDKTELRRKVLDILAAIAPELDPATLQPDAPLRTQVDLDSFDWLRFLLALHEALDVEIPETDYRELATLNRLIAYLEAKLPG